MTKDTSQETLGITIKDGRLALVFPSGSTLTLRDEAPCSLIRQILEARRNGARTIGTPGQPTHAQVDEILKAMMRGVRTGERPKPSRRLDTKGHDKDVTLSDLGLE